MIHDCQAHIFFVKTKNCSNDDILISCDDRIGKMLHNICMSAVAVSVRWVSRGPWASCFCYCFILALCRWTEWMMTNTRYVVFFPEIGLDVNQIKWHAHKCNVKPLFSVKNKIFFFFFNFLHVISLTFKFRFESITGHTDIAVHSVELLTRSTNIKVSS